MNWWFGFVSAFLASGVEVVEAVTIVLAAGVTRGWRSTWIGVVSASVVLAVLVALLGPALQTFIPIDALRIVVGTLLLIFGLQWLRKSIMRYTGLKELHDEERIYQREVRELSNKPLALSAANGEPVTQARVQGMDWTAFTVSFKGVLLEGLEVIFIVLTFSLSAGDFTPTVLGAVAAAVIVIGLAAAVHAPLSKVPENTLKFVVGLMLCGFGTFWSGEGIGLQWPGEDLSIVGLIGFYAVISGIIIFFLRQRSEAGMQKVGGV